VPNETGEKFKHVKTGVASQDYLKKMLDDNFEPFSSRRLGFYLPDRQLRHGSGEPQELGV
jgi:hypothetical protein